MEFSMKKKITILLVFFSIAVTSCFAQTTSALTSFEAVYDYLSTARGGTQASNPVSLVVSIDLGDMTADGSGWQNLLSLIGTREKYVALDLSLCTINSTEFNPTSSNYNGHSKIVSLILPNTARSIVGRFTGSILYVYGSLRTVSAKEVTSIGSFAFNGLNLTDVNFPSVVTIGSSAFSGCTSLKSVSFPKLISISNNVFSRCVSLTSADFPVATTIENNAFRNCSSLTSVTFPLVTSISSGAFQNCSNLTSVSFPMVKIISGRRGDYPGAFIDCTSLTSINFPSVSTIGDGAFYCDALTSITIAANCDIQGTRHGVRFVDFKSYYELIRGKRSGTYKWNGTAWTGP